MSGCIDVKTPETSQAHDSGVTAILGALLDQGVTTDIDSFAAELFDAEAFDTSVSDAEVVDSMLHDAGGDAFIDCDPAQVFDRNGCIGCHGAASLGGLDLRAQDFARLMVDAPAQAEGCQNRKLLDVDRPSHSLILQVVGAVSPPAGDEDSCQLVMPPLPEGLIPEADRACLTQWVEEVASDYRGDPIVEPEPETDTLRSSLQKVKTLLRGDALTAEEYIQVSTAGDEGAATQALVRTWTNGPAFDRKLMAFLRVALQQELQNFETDQFDRLRGNRASKARVRKVLSESFVRTALDLVHRDQPFTQVATTQTWMMTTANLILLQYGDQSASERARPHRIFTSRDDAPNALRQQINRRRWFFGRSEAGRCTVPQTEMLNFLFGSLRRRHCDDHEFRRNNFTFGLEDSLLTQGDFEDWRLVTLEFDPNASVDERIPFYDIRRLRTATSLKTRVPRVGFFSTNAFFENWMTNDDNQFRVAVNQSLLGGLHTRFSATEPTEPLRVDGIDGAHAENQDCMGCHRQVDPMRAYFAKSFNTSYQRPFGDGGDGRILRGVRPVFTFYGRRSQGGDLRRFGRLIAEHPKFASAWVQKLCLFANSARCDPNDPEFRQIRNRFRDGGFNFKSMLVELFSSRLVTGRGSDASPLPVSITRRDHLCAVLAERTGNQEICNIRRVANIIGLIPKDAVARGAADPSMPVRPNPIYLATAEAVCDAVARTVVTNARNAPFSGATPDQTIERIVNQLMGLAGDPTRATEVREILKTHFDEARAASVSKLGALRSVFSIGCLSPDVMGMGL